MLQDAVEPQVNYGKTNNDIFLGKEDPDLCDIGPTYWCQSEKTRNVGCNAANTADQESATC